jgi:hypothetical protein
MPFYNLEKNSFDGGQEAWNLQKNLDFAMI